MFLIVNAKLIAVILKVVSLIVLIYLQAINCLQAQYVYKIAYWGYNGGAVLKESKYDFYLEMYNSDSLLIEKRSAFSTNNTYNKTIFEYNEKGQKIFESDFYLIDKPSIKRSYEYNNNGLLQSMTYRTRNKEGDTIQVRETYFYTDSGKLIEKTQTASKSFQSTTTTYKYEYKPSKTIITELELVYGKKKPQKRVIVYNEKRLIIRESGKDFKREYTYEYDQNGDWAVKKVCEVRGVWQCHGEYRKTLVNISSQ